jgi:PAS domain S-box-containing protein
MFNHKSNHEKEQKLLIEASNKEWIDAFDAIQDAVMLHNKGCNIIRVNRAYKELTGVQKYKEIIGRPYYEVFPKLKSPMHTCNESVRSGQEGIEEFILDDGRIFRSRTYPIVDERGEYSYGIHLFEDITEVRRKEEEIREFNATLHLISRCNKILVRSLNTGGLIKDLCNEIIKDEAYDFTGIFLKREGSVLCHYHASTTEYLDEITEVNLIDEHYRDFPVIVAIKEQQLICINDISHDPKWSDVMKRHSEICPAAPYDMEGAMLILPLKDDENSGALVIYTRHPNWFDDMRTGLFNELSDDVNYSIHTLRLREQYTQVSTDRANVLIQLKESLEGTIQSIGLMVEARDPYMAGHQNRVSALAVAIGKKIGMDDNRIEGLKLAGIVHDIGKIRLPSEILTKPTKLNYLEYEMIKTHPQIGYDILKDIHFPWPIAQMIYQHHERLDGSGYPNGLKGDEILLEAKILIVADIVEAMASHRPYRASLGIIMAMEEIEKYKGIYYDPVVVDTCVELFENDGYELL